MNRQQVVDAINWGAAMSAPRCAFGHVEVMDVLFRDAVVIAKWVEDDYEGDLAYAYQFHDGTVAIVTDSFGSCRGCDSWDDASDDEARAMLHSLASNARLFAGRKAALEFCEHEAAEAEHWHFRAARNLCRHIKEVSEPELPPCPPGDGWIEWGGGECPVEPTTDVEVQFRNGDVIDNPAGNWNWEHVGCNGDIILYRVHRARKRADSDSELMALYASSAALVRKDRQGGGRVDSWARINGIMHVGISGDPSKWSADGLRLYWEHVDGRPCGVEVSDD